MTQRFGLHLTPRRCHSRLCPETSRFKILPRKLPKSRRDEAAAIGITKAAAGSDRNTAEDAAPQAPAADPHSEGSHWSQGVSTASVRPPRGTGRGATRDAEIQQQVPSAAPESCRALALVPRSFPRPNTGKEAPFLWVSDEPRWTLQNHYRQLSANQSIKSRVHRFPLTTPLLLQIRGNVGVRG